MFKRLKDRLVQGKAPIVPILRLFGAIGSMPGRRGGLDMQSLAGPIQAAFELKGAKAVILSINSPGGSPVQSSLIAERIRTLAAEKNLPVVAFVEDIAASGGYWLALAADEIFVDANSIVGSIGVITSGFGFTEAITKLGIERRSHTTGPSKGMLDPFRPESETDREILHELQADIFQTFKDHVRQRRGATLTADDEELFSGRVWTGKRAVELGLVDHIGHMHAEMRKRFGERVRLVSINPRRSWLQRRLGIGASTPLPPAGELLAAFEERLLYNRYGL